MIEVERKKFEAAASKNDYLNDEGFAWEDGDYCSPRVATAWVGWQLCAFSS